MNDGRATSGGWIVGLAVALALATVVLRNCGTLENVHPTTITGTPPPPD